ncbi:uncharacterized protein SPPG_02929 [Spizellomyces punctatus DAOM BR117]|uniref:Uncharacterized protein n=1 Tax=Spizellomyces punctatus (strain DAOM BR117) TaxID=645134 RepID=A0A0L0HM02_SPIPD|nr:uncharacterized protein SPPG_02929 [Spizellomyces punctatus DAOM BR117]KND02466.1 hypothetical protein SPPG_02929 [Spizellomyces punctatus DAOM BR117]|eukprot:XP_016610505.1 hypothetical protein SPPG_02929 [Spizellomyces punctatus DAOM BR117]
MALQLFPTTVNWNPLQSRTPDFSAQDANGNEEDKKGPASRLGIKSRQRTSLVPRALDVAAGQLPPQKLDLALPRVGLPSPGESGTYEYEEVPSFSFDAPFARRTADKDRTSRRRRGSDGGIGIRPSTSSLQTEVTSEDVAELPAMPSRSSRRRGHSISAYTASYDKPDCGPVCTTVTFQRRRMASEPPPKTQSKQLTLPAIDPNRVQPVNRKDEINPFLSDKTLTARSRRESIVNRDYSKNVWKPAGSTTRYTLDFVQNRAKARSFALRARRALTRRFVRSKVSSIAEDESNPVTTELEELGIFLIEEEDDSTSTPASRRHSARRALQQFLNEEEGDIDADLEAINHKKARVSHVEEEPRPESAQQATQKEDHLGLAGEEAVPITQQHTEEKETRSAALSRVSSAPSLPIIPSTPSESFPPTSPLLPDTSDHIFPVRPSRRDRESSRFRGVEVTPLLMYDPIMRFVSPHAVEMKAGFRPSDDTDEGILISEQEKACVQIPPTRDRDLEFPMSTEDDRMNANRQTHVMKTIFLNDFLVLYASSTLAQDADLSHLVRDVDVLPTARPTSPTAAVDEADIPIMCWNFYSYLRGPVTAGEYQLKSGVLLPDDVLENILGVMRNARLSEENRVAEFRSSFKELSRKQYLFVKAVVGHLNRISGISPSYNIIHGLASAFGPVLLPVPLVESRPCTPGPGTHLTDSRPIPGFRRNDDGTPFIYPALLPPPKLIRLEVDVISSATPNSIARTVFMENCAPLTERCGVLALMLEHYDALFSASLA